MPAIPTALKCKDSKMCDCAIELEKRNKKEAKKASHSVQTDASGGLDFGALFSNLSGMLDSVGPWIPYIGGSALIIMLLGFLSKNVDKVLGMFEYDYEDTPSEPEAHVDSCKTKCTLKIDTNKIKWPNR